MECHVRTQIVFSFFAVSTASTRSTRFNGNNVSWFKASYLTPHFDDLCRSFVSKNHWLLNNKLSDPSMCPVVNIGSTDSDRHRFQHDLYINSVKGFLKNLLNLMNSPLGPGGVGRGICFRTNSPFLRRTTERLSFVMI